MKGWRGRSLLVAIAALYLGVFLGGHVLPFGVAMPFGLALLILYTLLMRPMSQYGGPGAAGALRLGLTLATLAALAALLAGAGRGLAVLTGPLPLPPWAGPALALAGVALSRAVWSARKAAEMDSFLDDAIEQIKGLAPDAPGPSPSGPAAQQSMADWLLAGFANDLHEEGAGRDECDNLVRQLVKLDEPEVDTLGTLREWRSFHPLCEAALLRYVGHPFTLGLRIDADLLVDWIEAALTQPETAFDAAAAAHGWLDKAQYCGGFGATAPRLLAAVKATLAETQDGELQGSLLALQTMLERPE